MEDISKLKVAELRAELNARGLDTKGVKAQLIERLRAAIEAENSPEDSENQESETNEEDVEEDEAQDVAVVQPENDVVESLQKEDSDKPQDKLPEEAPQEETTSVNEEPAKEVITDHVNEEKKQDYEEAPLEDIEDIKKEVDAPTQNEDSAVKQEESEPMDGQTEIKQEEYHGQTEVKSEDNHDNNEVKQEDAHDQGQDQEDHDQDDDGRGRKRKVSEREDDYSYKRYREDDDVRPAENEPEFDLEEMALDWYNSDLSLQINEADRLEATPLTRDGFAYVWHGVRATHGFTKGRIFYEVKVEENLDAHMETDELHPHVVRVGWSVDDSSLVLGEDVNGWGYGGTGKASTNLKFKDYGKTFGEGDVIGCCIDMEVEPIVMSFTVNGDHQGICYEIAHSEIGDAAMYPHILTKNCRFSVNFGNKDPAYEMLPDYTFAAKVSATERVLGSQRPEKREDCEVIMMVGIPGAGKTTWVNQYVKNFSEKKYYVLGTNFLIDKMKVNGLPRKKNYAGRWDVLIE